MEGGMDKGMGIIDMGGMTDMDDMGKPQAYLLHAMSRNTGEEERYPLRSGFVKWSSI